MLKTLKQIKWRWIPRLILMTVGCLGGKKYNARWDKIVSETLDDLHDVDASITSMELTRRNGEAWSVSTLSRYENYGTASPSYYAGHCKRSKTENRHEEHRPSFITMCRLRDVEIIYTEEGSEDVKIFVKTFDKYKPHG